MATIKEKGQPTRQTKGAVGDIYINIITGKSYKCVNAYRVGDEGDYFWQPTDAKAEEPTKETKKPTKKAEPKAESVAEEAKVDGEPVEAPAKESNTAKKQRVNYSKAFEAKED